MLPNTRNGYRGPRCAVAPVAVFAAALVTILPARAGSPGPLAFADAWRCSADPDAATTVPGWITVAGSPSLRCANSLHAAWPAEHVPRVVITSGPYGASTLERVIPLRTQTPTHRRLTLSAWFAASGHTPARAVLSAIFLGPSGQMLGSTDVLSGPRAPPRTGPLRFEALSVAGDIPRGAAALKLRLDLAGATAHARSYVAALRLEVQPPLALRPPSPPPANVPHFDHVFVIMMENTDYGQLIGDDKNAPYMNALAARGALLANYQAIYHPSDENYLAIAGGDAFVMRGVYFPNLQVAARNLGDLVEAAGKTWRAYEEGMGTPCNTSTRYDKNYEPDDAPFILFRDIRGNPGRCRAHLVDLREWPRDLQHVASTPVFAWLAADDYDDGELPGNGSPKSLQVQDAWLRATLEPLFSSPAWREQKSLLILTWDESDTTVNNHIPTIVLGSRLTVKSGYVSRIRYDHYSSARTIEAALGLPAMTSNDQYARTFDDVFVGR
ncbi:MAG: alkaline phosphatase family protein [Steroidobacteraceae bacterium]